MTEMQKDFEKEFSKARYRWTDETPLEIRNDFKDWLSKAEAKSNRLVLERMLEYRRKPQPSRLGDDYQIDASYLQAEIDSLRAIEGDKDG